MPHTLIADVGGRAGLHEVEVDAILVGADRVAANGDTANKIGTYPLAVIAARHGIPFYVCAPTSTLDLATADGAGDHDRGAGPEEVLNPRRAIAPPEHPSRSTRRSM